MPLPPLDDVSTRTGAMALLAASSAAHGGASLADVTDINVSYAGTWHALVDTLQPDLVDAGFRGTSEERWLVRDRRVGQAHHGPSGRKQVVRALDRRDVRVWFNGVPSQDQQKQDAAALVADGYALFLLGPILLASQWASEKSLVVAVMGDEEAVVQSGGTYRCAVVRAHLTPGLGRSPSDELALFLDRDGGLMRRVRFTLNGLEATRGAIAEVDTLGHVSVGGIQWPTRFQERLLRPLPIPVHDWQLTGLDLNRGFTAADIAGPEFTGRAVPPASARLSG